MNETMLDLDQYVAEVRRGLVDLDAETRDELTDGLAADLAELVEERGSGALPRPEEYAAELRASAGLPPAARRPLLEPDWWRPAWEFALVLLPTSTAGAGFTSDRVRSARSPPRWSVPSGSRSAR